MAIVRVGIQKLSMNIAIMTKIHNANVIVSHIFTCFVYKLIHSLKALVEIAVQHGRLLL